MAGEVFDIVDFLKPETLARHVSEQYTRWRTGRDAKELQWKELRNYLFATDTTTTTNSKLPWKNKTTRPKLCQIRDNLHSNYMAALFPNERWFKWLPSNPDSATKEKANAIIAWAQAKFRESQFKQIVSRFIYDYIDYGNCIGDVQFSNEVNHDAAGKPIPVYVGPRLVRVSPLDIVFDITGPTSDQVPKITRTLLSLGQVEKLRLTDPDWAKVGAEVWDKIKDNRKRIVGQSQGLEASDFHKMAGYLADGFNTLVDYYASGMVEFLEMEGDVFDPETGKFYQNHIVTIVDRAYVVRSQPAINWYGKSYKQHCGWRLRPDNLLAMGPLDNLVGMQYRIDHLENLKADVFDLIAFPPLKVKGYVEDFEWGPYERIYMEETSEVEPLAPDATALNADLEIQRLEQAMEDMAGAPKQAMGVRTPGEKTAFEYQELINAAGRTFQMKAMAFEEAFLEPLMNNFLECARRNMQGEEIVRAVDDEEGVSEFMTITPDDLTAKGKLVPMGARHFAAQAQLIQNLVNLSSTTIYQDPAVMAHLSGKKIAQLLEENLNLERFGVFRPNVRVEEQLETQQMTMQAEEELQVNAMTPTETTEDLPEDPGADQDI